MRLAQIILLLTLGLAALASSAKAAVTNTDLGTLGIGNFSLPPSPPASPDPVDFQDNYMFFVEDGVTDLDVSGSWSTTPGDGDVEGTIVTMLLLGPGGAEFATLGPGNTFTLSAAGLTTGVQYEIQIYGWAAPGGTLTYGGNIAAVPLPAAVWLLGSALLALLVFGRVARRPNTQIDV